MRTYRIISQTIFLSLFLALFIYAIRTPLGYRFPSAIFIWLNPLVSAITSVASRSVVLPALWFGIAIALATIVFGRFFCGFVCPLGAIIDFSDRFLFKKMIAAGRRPPIYVQRLKYVALIGLIVLSVLGVVFPLFMDPISLLTRISAILLHPLALIVGGDTVHAMAGAGLERMSVVTVNSRYFYASAGALGLFALVLAGGFWDRRFWCQYVCPSGAFFGLLGRYAIFRRSTIGSGCNDCRRCARVCPTRAIDEKSVARTNVGECVVCGVCTGLKESCSRFGFFARSSERVTGPDIKRRHVLGGALAAVAALPLFRANALTKRDTHGKLIRPPGAVPENLFSTRCIACGACMKACPTNAIQPCTAADGIHRLFTPKLVARVGACEEKCHLCGYVCPTGAIRKLSLDSKRMVKVGTAVIDRHRCLAWSQNKECLVCDEVCPYNAVDVKVEQTTKGMFKVPVVAEDYCMGCGWCEKHCPIEDLAAIVVFKFGEKRLESGEYVSDVQRRRIEEWRTKSDSHLTIGAQQSVVNPAGVDAGSAGQGYIEGNTAGGMPPGFSD